MPPFDTTDKEDNTPDELLQVINALVTEVQPNRRTREITLDTSFEKDLGLDSLTRVELVSRVECLRTIYKTGYHNTRQGTCV